MTDGELTIKILQGIRDDLKQGSRETNQRLDAMQAELAASRREANERFEVIETAIRDMAEQLVMLARGVKSALEVRGAVEKRLDDCERRLDRLEQREPH